VNSLVSDDQLQMGGMCPNRIETVVAKEDERGSPVAADWKWGMFGPNSPNCGHRDNRRGETIVFTSEMMPRIP
jgi:hypothetical protein